MSNLTTRLRLRRYLRWSATSLVVVALFMVACNWWVLRYADRYLFERPYLEARGDSSNIVAIVPGAFVRGGQPSSTLEDRLQTALELYDAGVVSRILVSGDHASVNYDEVTVMQAWLVAKGVPANDILVDHAGFRTLDTMVRARTVFLVERAVVCTQRFHLARAVFLARRAGLDAHGVVADRRRYPAHYTDQIRETVARTVAIIDSYILRREPRFRSH